jgi:hypothetical protein
MVESPERHQELEVDLYLIQGDRKEGNPQWQLPGSLYCSYVTPNSKCELLATRC